MHQSLAVKPIGEMMKQYAAERKAAAKTIADGISGHELGSEPTGPPAPENENLLYTIKMFLQITGNAHFACA